MFREDQRRLLCSALRNIRLWRMRTPCPPACKKLILSTSHQRTKKAPQSRCFFSDNIKRENLLRVEMLANYVPRRALMAFLLRVTQYTPMAYANSLPACVQEAHSVHGSPKNEKSTSIEVLRSLVTRGRIELPFQP